MRLHYAGYGASCGAHPYAQRVTGNLSLNLLYEVSAGLLGELRAGEPQRKTIDRLGAAYAGTKAAVDALIKGIDAELAGAFGCTAVPRSTVFDELDGITRALPIHF